MASFKVFQNLNILLAPVILISCVSVHDANTGMANPVQAYLLNKENVTQHNMLGTTNKTYLYRVCNRTFAAVYNNPSEEMDYLSLRFNHKLVDELTNGDPAIQPENQFDSISWIKIKLDTNKELSELYSLIDYSYSFYGC